MIKCHWTFLCFKHLSFDKIDETYFVHWQRSFVISVCVGGGRGEGCEIIKKLWKQQKFEFPKIRGLYPLLQVFMTCNYTNRSQQKEVMTNIFKIHFLTLIYSKQQYLPA